MRVKDGPFAAPHSGGKLPYWPGSLYKAHLEPAAKEVGIEGHFGWLTIPAYAAMQENGISSRMLDVLMRGLSTRQYAEVLPEMASTCGVSRSNVSREAAEAGEAALQELLERRFEEVDLLVIYLDGMVFGEHHMISAVGVDRRGPLGEMESSETRQVKGNTGYCRYYRLSKRSTQSSPSLLRTPNSRNAGFAV